MNRCQEANVAYGRTDPAVTLKVGSSPSACECDHDRGERKISEYFVHADVHSMVDSLGVVPQPCKWQRHARKIH